MRIQVGMGDKTINLGIAYFIRQIKKTAAVLRLRVADPKFSS